MGAYARYGCVLRLMKNDHVDDDGDDNDDGNGDDDDDNDDHGDDDGNGDGDGDCDDGDGDGDDDDGDVGGDGDVGDSDDIAMVRMAAMPNMRRESGGGPSSRPAAPRPPSSPPRLWRSTPRGRGTRNLRDQAEEGENGGRRRNN